MMLSPRFGMNATPFAATDVRYSESGEAVDLVVVVHALEVADVAVALARQVEHVRVVVKVAE